VYRFIGGFNLEIITKDYGIVGQIIFRNLLYSVQMILLSSKVGSKVVTVACYECGRISRQISKDEYGSQPNLMLCSNHTCPICETIHSSFSVVDRDKWSVAYSRYLTQGEQSYNNDVKNAYQTSSKHQTTENSTIAEEKVMICGIEISGMGLYYSYISTDPTIKIGDRVIVPFGSKNKENIGTVMDIGYYAFNKTPYPIEKTKKIIKKADIQTTPTTDTPVQQTAATIPTIKPVVELPSSSTAMFDRKIDYWKNKLLDLSKRNKMINYRETKRTTIKILEPEFVELFNRLAIKEEELTFQRPIDKNFKPKISAMLSLLEALAYPIPVQLGDIKTDRPLADRRMTLANLHSKSKLARDEQGTNILYLSFGFIEWKEDNSANGAWLKSPLLIMPVSLILKSIQSPFILARYDDDIEVNPTLIHLFKECYDIDLPAFKLENEKSIELYMQIIEKLTNKNSWKLTREVNLGLLSFLKIGMYYDIEDNRNKMLKNPVIRAITGDTDAVNAIYNSSNELSNIAYDNLHPKDCYQVVSSDSSQQEAIILSKAGVSFVMQGPPGTGKSQTITNIIAEALADGKKVLFVSEKAAALQVVYRRLLETGLSDFCLALHSHKANKKEILDSIAANIKLEHKHIKDDIMSELGELFENRQHLNRYVSELHEKILPLEKSPYEVFGELMSLHSISEVPFKLNIPPSFSSSDYHKMLYSVSSYAKALENLGIRFSENPWHGAVNRLSQNIHGLDKSLFELNSIISEILNIFKLNENYTWNGIQHIILLFSSIETLPLFPKTWSDSSLREKLLNEAKQAIEEKQKYLNALNIVTTYFNESIFDENLESWLKSVRQNIDGIKQITKLQVLNDEAVMNMAKDYYNDTIAVITQLESMIIPPDNIDVFDLIEFFNKVASTVIDLKHEWFYTKVKQILLDVQKHSTLLQNKLQQVLEEWEDSILSIDTDSMLSRFKSEYTSFLRIFKSSYRADIKTLRISSKKIGVKFKYQEIISSLLLLKEINSEKKWFLERMPLLKATVNTVKNEILPQIKNLNTSSKTLLDLMQSVNIHSKQSIQEDKLLKIVFVANYLINARKNMSDTNWDAIITDLKVVSSFFTNTLVSTMSDEFIASVCDNSDYRLKISEAKINLKHQINNLEPNFNIFNSIFTKEADFANLNLIDLSKKVSACLGNLALLDSWLVCAETKSVCDELGLSDFTAKIEQSDNTIKNVVDVFKHGFYTVWLQGIIENKKLIKQFRRHVHDEKVSRFIFIDKKQLLMARERIREKIIDKVNNNGSNLIKTANSEWSILQKEMNKKRNIMPLRKLFKNIPNLLLKLKPCMMMSPLSVAYFLEAESYEFDMVIFDEASQIFPQDAIGAIFRSKQVIIAGDSKQLPPTNFFATNTSNDGDDCDKEDEDEYDDEIYDSILEETAGVLPSRTLLWHYRSKHENLIAFSNQNIYENDLITFPSNIEAAPDLGLEFIFVENGIYEGKGRNTQEARRCVELVKEHFDKYPDRSLGIIAFSESQQKTILYEIQEFREQNQEYEKFFVENKEDEFFVKNLENVQGDERDTIIFSISYAKTKDQRDNNRSMSLRFGPLGLKGGERRLNVAITRAKRNIKLVSSILPSDIDLSRTQSEGIKMLRSYIEFAKNGSIALQTNSAVNEEDVFTNTVAEFIASQGYEIKKCLGCSGYKIDIAIINPKIKNCFAAGIECDGFSYASTKTARDRDHLRKSVLEAMGWNIYRVWSPEWINQPDIEQQKLLNFIKNSIGV
jgi:very-short-patch-repair endonuclease